MEFNTLLFPVALLLILLLCFIIFFRKPVNRGRGGGSYRGQVKYNNRIAIIVLAYVLIFNFHHVLTSEEPFKGESTKDIILTVASIIFGIGAIALLIYSNRKKR